MIPLAKPIIAKNAKKYLVECLNTGWVSSKGPFVEKFENEFAKFIGVKYAVATSSGTSAIHLALVALGVGPGDEVIVPALTMIAAALPIIYVGAKPALVDVEKDTGNIDALKIEEKITAKTKAIIVVHFNGHPADLWPIIKLARKYNLKVIEDAAEAHGAQYKLGDYWKKVGSMGDIGCFSFYGNKLITSGEGGMITTNNKILAGEFESLRNLARSKRKHFFHLKIGFTYRMSSLQAALGLAQLEEVEKFLKIKEHLASVYVSQLIKIPSIILPAQKSFAKRLYWNFDILIKENSKTSRDKLAQTLEKNGVETRIFVIPLHHQPAFLKLGLFASERYENAEELSKQGLSLPLGLALGEKDIYYICKILKNTFK